MVAQLLPRTLQPPPELPNDSTLSDTLAQYLRTFALWCRHGFADKLSGTTALPGINLLAYNAAAGVLPTTWLLQVGQVGGLWVTPVTPGSGDLGTPIKVGAIGVIDGSNATAGQIGEVLAAQTPVGVTLPSNVATNLLTLSLTPGDWDLHGEVWMIAAAGGVTTAAAAVNTATATLPGGSQPNTGRSQFSGAITAGGGWFIPIQTVRASVSVATNYYLIALSLHPSGTTTASGCLWARRMR